MMKQSLDFMVQTAQEIDLRAEQEEIIKHYQESRRILKAECASEFAFSAKLRDIITQEQDHEIDLRNAVEPR
jgi:bacterioferritin